jgi:hypothetical protein
MKNRYRMPNVREAMERRYEFLADLDSWKVEMTARINARFARLSPADRGRLAFFRWHDSGDLQSVSHLAAVAWVARHTPRVRHWLPTREYAIVREFLANGLTLPKNLTVRLSAHMVNGPTPDGYGLPVSSVHTEPGRYSATHSCPADSQGGRCGECRACWSPDVRHVSYPRH